MSTTIFTKSYQETCGYVDKDELTNNETTFLKILEQDEFDDIRDIHIRRESDKCFYLSYGFEYDDNIVISYKILVKKKIYELQGVSGTNAHLVIRRDLNDFD